MKLASLKDSSRDGRLVIVSRDLQSAAPADDIAPTLQHALEHWDELAPRLNARYELLNRNICANSFGFDPTRAAAPLPRAYQWCDASAFLTHSQRTRQAFNVPPSPDAGKIPLMYQGASDDFLGPCDDVPFPDESQGIDFEAEFGVIVDNVPMACSAAQAGSHIKLAVLINDWSLRNVAQREVKTGFGFLQSKPSTSFAPVAVTPDELGAAWQNGSMHLRINIERSGQWFGHPSGAEMHFNFDQLIAYASATRRLRAGTIVGSGTVSNADVAAGFGCITECRMVETIRDGASKTEYLRYGERVRMEVLDSLHRSVFGTIDQRVVRYQPAAYSRGAHAR